MTFTFKPEDFVGNDDVTAMLEKFVKRANAKLQEHLSTLPVVYGIFTKRVLDMAAAIATMPEDGDTHRAILFNVEPIEKMPCEHEPQINNDPGRFGVSIPYNVGQPLCRHCGAKLKARWEVGE